MRHRRPDTIDWTDVRERLTRAAAHDGRAERAERALVERARALATPPSSVPRRLVPGVALDSGQGRYALPAQRVLRIERGGPPSRLPGTPPFALGLLPLSGRPWLLLDLPAFLGAAPPRTEPPRWAVLLAAAGAEIALAADAVALFDLAPDELHPAAADPEHLRRGLTQDARLVLDAAVLIARATDRLRGPGGPHP